MSTVGGRDSTRSVITLLCNLVNPHKRSHHCGIHHSVLHIHLILTLCMEDDSTYMLDARKARPYSDTFFGCGSNIFPNTWKHRTYQSVLKTLFRTSYHNMGGLALPIRSLSHTSPCCKVRILPTRRRKRPLAECTHK